VSVSEYMHAIIYRNPKHRAFYVICGTNKETLLSLIKCAPPGIDREQADKKWKEMCVLRALRNNNWRLRRQRISNKIMSAQR